MKNSGFESFLTAFKEHFGKNGFFTFVLLRLAGLMLLFSICRLAFYAYNTELFPEMTAGKMLTILAGGLKFDLSALLYTNLLFLIIYLIPSPLRLKKAGQGFAKFVFYLTNGLALSLNCTDMIFYPFTLRRTTSAIFREFENENNFVGVIGNTLTEHWPVVLFFLGLLFLMVKIHGKAVFPKPESRPAAHYSVGVLTFLLAVPLILGGLRGGFLYSTRPITLSNAGEFVEFPHEMNIVLNTPFAVFRTLGKASLQEKTYFSPEESEQIYSPVHRPALPDSAEFKYENVVIFIIESYGKEFIGSLNPQLENGEYAGYTPFTDSLLSRSKTYWHTFANGKKSIDAMPSVLASIPSGKSPYVLSHYSGNKIDGLANLLKTKGYQSGFFHGAPNGSMGFQSFANLAGFDKYYGKTEYGNDADYDGIWGIWDDKFFQFYARSLGEMKPPFFGALFSVSSHHPYGLPDDYRGKVKEGPTPLHACINYTDQSLRKFFEFASRQPWFKNTLFVLTADHTPSEPNFPAYRTAAGLYKVPIIFYHPAHPEWAGTESTDIIQQIDIMPSVLGYLNYDKPYFAFGRNVFDSLSAPFAVNYSGNAWQFLAEDYLLQYDDNQEKTVGFYNFKTDTLLLQNLQEKQPAGQAEIEKKMKAFIQQYHSALLKNKMSVGEN